MKFEEIFIIIEGILDRAMKKRPQNSLQQKRSPWSNTHHAKSIKSSKPEKDLKKVSAGKTPQNTKGKEIFHFFKQSGHYSIELAKRRSIINNMEMEVQNHLSGVDKGIERFGKLRC